MDKFEELWKLRPWYTTSKTDKDFALHWFGKGVEYARAEPKEDDGCKNENTEWGECIGYEPKGE